MGGGRLTIRLRSLRRSLVLLGLFVGASMELVWTRPRTRMERAGWLHRFCLRAMRRLRVRTEVRGAFPEGGAVICNHMSYLDIVVFASLYPSVFVAKAEIERWPVLGWMTTMSGSVYVARGRGGSAAAAESGIRAAAESGVPIVFFPEGTTTKGESVLPFRSGLLGQVMLDGLRVTAASVRYRLAEENGAGVTVADDVAYWGDAALLPHIFRFLGLRGVVAEVRFAPEPIGFTAAATRNRKAGAAEARAAVITLLGSEAAG